MKKFIFMLSVSLLLLTACSKDDDVLVQQNGDVAFVNKTFSATCKGQKAAFVPNTTLEQGFQQGDQVFIYGDIYGNPIGQPGSVDVSSSVVRADNNNFYSMVTFNVPVPQDESSFHAIMPYQATMTEGKVTLPTLQVADKGSNDRTANILYASSSNEIFAFNHACAYIRLRVKGNSKSAMRFVIRSSQPLSGVCGYEFGNGFKLTGTRENGGDSVSLTTQNDNANIFENDTAYFATVLPTIDGNKSTVIYEVKDADGKVVASCAVINRKFEAGKIYTVTLDGDKLTATGESATVPGLFSVSDNKKVTFSKGNLQYNASANTWRFAEHQWDYVGSPSLYGQNYNEASGNVSGSDNAYIGNDGYNGWIDLFGWGTGDNPTKHTEDNADYSTFTDWGSNSKLITDLGAGWRTLSCDEWNYLIVDTEGSRKDRCGHATVNGVVGIVLLPDEWVTPNGSNFTPGYGSGWTTNSYSVKQWTKMEKAGAVFLPAAGDRLGQLVYDVGDYGCYWSSTPNDAYDASYAYRAYYFGFNSGSLHIGLDVRFCGGVRLVR